jgi:protease I
MRWPIAILLSLSLFLSACGNQITGNVVKDTGSKAVLIIVSEEDYRAIDVDALKESIESGGPSVTVVYLAGNTSQETNLSDQSISDYDLVVLMTSIESDEAIAALRLAQATGKTIAAERMAPLVLAKAGMLRGKTVTVFPRDDAIAALEDAGAVYTSDPVVRDDGLITSSGVGPPQEFGSAIIEALGG